jgi:hypothetical protein
MKPITPLLIFLLILLVIIACFPYTMENFNINKDANTDINLNLKINNDNVYKRPRVIVPLYAPWRMYYPYESVYSLPVPWQYQSSPFYPFFDQYNIYQNMIPWNN